MRDDGVDLSRLTYDEIRVLRKDLQIVFQDPYSSLNPRLTVGQAIEEGLTTHNMFRGGSDEAREYILQVMRDCGLQDYMLHRYPHQFSGGQRQRICIARALAVNPKFVVCDECVSALDVSIQSQIINLLQELKEKQNLTYLFISHDLSVVKYISDRIGVMYLGNIVELADKNAIFDDPRHPYTVALLSSIPTTDPDSADKERIILEGSIPSPINPPTGCKFHTRCYMATEKCSRIAPCLTEVEPGHYLACHYPERKLDENGNYLFKAKTMGGKVPKK
jgi:peptide/nickel transport system ATP-binding protein